MRLPIITFSLFIVVAMLGARQNIRAQEVQQVRESTTSPEGANSQTTKKSEANPYRKVITPEAKSQAGVFTVHTINGKVYYEIPTGELGKDFLLVSRIAKKNFKMDYNPNVPRHIVRWKRRGNRVLLYSISYFIGADDKLQISEAVRNANDPEILMTFPIETFGNDDAPVIDATRLFVTDVPELYDIHKEDLNDVYGKLENRQMNVGGLDPARSFIERVIPHPSNIEVEATHTYGSTEDLESLTVLLHFSMVKLPDRLMQPRLSDDRVGYWSLSRYDYGHDLQDTQERKYITRWRLEKKDPSASLSEPVRPITYYIDPNTPERWRPWIRRGIEDWQPVFEAAGFKNAIVAMDAPTAEEDPNWSPDDARYSVVRWLVTKMGSSIAVPPICDPRTGEILNAHIDLGHDYWKRIVDQMFVVAAPLDSRARKLPFPDELMARVIEMNVALNVGQTLGLRQGGKGSSYYPVDKLRDQEWVHKMGFTASILDTSPYNNVAQPEDNIPADDLINHIGPYDRWAIHWGYASIPGAESPDAERPTLDLWAREQDSVPWLRWVEAPPGRSQAIDPAGYQHQVGTNDPISSTRLKLKNLSRTVDLLVASTSRPGESYSDLKSIHDDLIDWSWYQDMRSVALMVGGIDVQAKHAGQAGVLFTPVSRERQSAAVHFLNENAFQTRQVLFLVPFDILDRIGPTGAVAHIHAVQSRVLGDLLDSDRFARLIEQEARDPLKAYGPLEFLADLHQGIWEELKKPDVNIDAYRHNLQRSYVDLLILKIQAHDDPNDTQPYFYAELQRVAREIEAANRRVSHPETRMHLDFVLKEIRLALEMRDRTAAAVPQ